MNEQEARRAVAEAGRRLLHDGLVARTWGNVSCRVDKHRFAVTPSGLGYEVMTADDVAVYDMADGTWRGNRRPSSEKGVHIAAYRRFPDAGFVIHTHQAYASALGLAGFSNLAPTAEEREALRGVALAEYGIPGTRRLWAHVDAALATGARCVLMAQHGALVVGGGPEDALSRARLLETVCRRACRGQPCEGTDSAGEAALAALARRMEGAFPCVSCTASPAVREASRAPRGIRAQLDDMAQMIGPRFACVPPEEGAVRKALQKRGAVLVTGLGALCRAETEGDCAALVLLAEKAAICHLHARALGVRAELSPLDAALMRYVYRKKYAAKIRG